MKKQPTKTKPGLKRAAVTKGQRAARKQKNQVAHVPNPTTHSMLLERIGFMGPFLVNWFAARINPDMPSTELALRYVEMRLVADAMATTAKAVADMYDKLRHETLPDAFERDKVSTVTLDGIGRVTASTQLFASIKKDMRDKAFAWLHDNQLGDLITETVNASTLSATAKALNEDGKELPEDIFGTFYKPTTSFTAAATSSKPKKAMSDA